MDIVERRVYRKKERKCARNCHLMDSTSWTAATSACKNCNVMHETGSIRMYTSDQRSGSLHVESIPERNIMINVTVKNMHIAMTDDLGEIEESNDEHSVRKKRQAMSHKA